MRYRTAAVPTPMRVLLLDDDRSWLRDHARETVAHFAAGERWNLATALHLTHQADGAVAESGVSGQRPEVRIVVDVAFDAYAAKNLTRLRLACAALRATLRRLKTSTTDGTALHPSRV